MPRIWPSLAKTPEFRDGERLLGRFRSANQVLYVTDQRVLAMGLGSEISIPYAHIITVRSGPVKTPKGGAKFLAVTVTTAAGATVLPTWHPGRAHRLIQGQLELAR